CHNYRKQNTAYSLAFLGYKWLYSCEQNDVHDYCSGTVDMSTRILVDAKPKRKPESSIDGEEHWIHHHSHERTRLPFVSCGVVENLLVSSVKAAFGAKGDNDSD